MSNSNNNQINIPQAREAGSVGDQTIKRPVRTAKYERHNRNAMGHIRNVQYIAAIT